MFLPQLTKTLFSRGVIQHLWKASVHQHHQRHGSASPFSTPMPDFHGQRLGLHEAKSVHEFWGRCAGKMAINEDSQDTNFRQDKVC